jgi:hypothetical protein
MVTFGGLTILSTATRTVTATPKAETASTPPSPGTEPKPLVKWAENPGAGAPSSPGALVDVQA